MNGTRPVRPLRGEDVAEARVLLGAAGRLAGHVADGDARPAELGAAIVGLLDRADRKLAPLEERRAHLRLVAS